jgi:hypothetical protein
VGSWPVQLLARAGEWLFGWLRIQTTLNSVQKVTLGFLRRHRLSRGVPELPFSLGFVSPGKKAAPAPRLTEIHFDSTMKLFDITACALALLLALGSVAAQDAGGGAAPSPSPPPTGGGQLNCSAIMPGCLACALTGSRRLLGTAAAQAAGDVQAIQSTFNGETYEQPTNFKCLTCDAASGYALNAKYGRCGEWGRPPRARACRLPRGLGALEGAPAVWGPARRPPRSPPPAAITYATAAPLPRPLECIMGYGSAAYDARCALCPAGQISRGGFLAQCADCGDYSWNNDFSSACREYQGLGGRACRRLAEGGGSGTVEGATRRKPEAVSEWEARRRPPAALGCVA